MNEIYFEHIKNKSDITVVFLHGWGLSGNSFNRIIGYLNDMSILKIDLPGFGLSKAPKDYFDTYEYSYQIFLLLKRLNLKKIILVGHSFGGRLSILLSSIYNVNLVGCVLTSSAGLNRFGLKKWIRVKIYKIIKFLVNKKIIKIKVLSRFGSRDYAQANLIMKTILVKVVNQDLLKFLSLIKVPTLLVWDKKDRDTRVWICKKLHCNIESSKIVYYNSGKHFCAFRNPSKFANLIEKLASNVR